MLDAGATAELIEKLEDSQMALGSMATNRYCAPFKEDVREWIGEARTVGEIVEMWLVVQNMWMYMEAVFTGGDIVKQLPQEAKRFRHIDKQFIEGGSPTPWRRERRGGVLRQRHMLEPAAAPHGAARAVPKGAHRVSGHEARAVPALLLRLRPDAAGDFVPRVGPASR